MHDDPSRESRAPDQAGVQRSLLDDADLNLASPPAVRPSMTSAANDPGPIGAAVWLYLLVMQDGRFKFGVSEHPIGYSVDDEHGLDWDRSRQVALPDSDEAYRWRRDLHEDLRVHRRRSTDGLTWFKRAGYPAALECLAERAKIVGAVAPLGTAGPIEADDARCNLKRMAEVASLWREVRRHLVMTRPTPTKLVLHGFKAASAGCWWRPLVLNRGTYRLVSRGSQATSLVRRSDYAELDPNDFVLTLTSPHELREQPGGPELMEQLGELLDQLVELDWEQS